MSKLMGLLLNSKNSLLSTAQNHKQLHLIRSLVFSSSSSTINNGLFSKTQFSALRNSSRRFLASQPAGDNKKPVDVKQSSSSPQNEDDKPEWERSTRYRIFYGYDYKNEAADKAFAHLYSLLGLLGFFFVPLFFIYYYPDYKTNDWCYREAYLELARREAAGEPLVNPDYVPSERIQLPSDEELGETEIII